MLSVLHTVFVLYDIQYCTGRHSFGNFKRNKIIITILDVTVIIPMAYSTSILFITARRYASAVYAMGLCPSVCVCVCLTEVDVLLKRLNT